MNLENLIDEFLKNKTNFSPSKSSTVKQLLKGESAYSLVNIPKSSNLEVDQDVLAEKIRDSIKKYTRDKDVAIEIYKKFLAFLERKYQMAIRLDFPPVSVSNSFERIMYIAKFLQDPSNKISDLEDKLLTNSRTIENDLAKLRGQKEPIQICGRKFIVNNINRKNGKMMFPSTVHPLFLTCNLTQVYVTLKGLKLMSEDVFRRDYAIAMANSIWKQLSIYGKNRIIYVCENLFYEDTEWYKNLEDVDYKAFVSESENSHNGKNVIMECLKNGKVCHIEYRNDTGGTDFLTNCRINRLPINGNRLQEVEIVYKERKMLLQSNRILKSTYDLEELI
jgi:hypothetical protein